MRRWWISLLASAVVTGSSVATNLATEWKHTLWAWLLVAGLTLAGAALTARIYRLDQLDRTPPPPTAQGEVTAEGERAVAAGGWIGMAVTGDHPDPTALAPPVPPRHGTSPATSPPGPGSRTVRAAGARSVAAGGDIGIAITGDHPSQQSDPA